MDQAKIGKFIAQLRHEQGLTQAQLGEKLGVTNKTVSRWENGNYMPELAAIPSLAAQLGVSVSELLAGERFAEDEYKRSADEQLLKVMRLVNDIRDFRSSSWLLEGMSNAALLVILPLLAFWFFVPMLEAAKNITVEDEPALLIVSLAVGIVGLAAYHLRHKSSLLKAGVMMLIFSAMWYNAYYVYTTGIMIGPLLFALIFIIISIYGYQVYFRKIDKLLEETRED